MRFSIYILSFWSLIFISCGKNEAAIKPEAKKNNFDPNIVVNTNLNNSLILQLVNSKRTAGCNCGLSVMPPVPALTWNNLLAAAASAHAKDMNTNNFFAHVSPNGTKIEDRYAFVGYKWLFNAENIATGQIDEQEVMTAWFASETHCKNIMNVNAKELGAAKEGKYWVQNFGAR